MNRTKNLKAAAAGLLSPGRSLLRGNSVSPRHEARQVRFELRQYRRLHQTPSREMVRRINELRWHGSNTLGMHGWDPARPDPRHTALYEQMWGPPSP